MCDHQDGSEAFDWEDIGLAGTLAEEMAAEERERQWLLKRVEPEEDGDSDL